MDAADLPFASIFGRAQMVQMSPLVFRESAPAQRAA